MEDVSVLKAVVASPSDVKAERNCLEDVVEEVNRGVAGDRRLRLELARWETDAYPGFHPEGPQGLVDKVLRIEDCDVVIGIFWKRFGTPTGDAESGTEHEIRKAYEGWKKDGRPQLMVYFNQAPYTPESKQETDQWGLVLEFRREFPKNGLWWPYNGPEEFERLTREHLTNYIRTTFRIGNTLNLEAGASGDTGDRGGAASGSKRDALGRIASAIRGRIRTALVTVLIIAMAIIGSGLLLQRRIVTKPRKPVLQTVVTSSESGGQLSPTSLKPVSPLKKEKSAIQGPPRTTQSKASQTPPGQNLESAGPAADWRDGKAWRRLLLQNMTKEQVRRLFGEPDQVSVFDEGEFWYYGDGELIFDLNAGPGGQLFSWSEPSRPNSMISGTKAATDERPKVWQDKQAWRRLLRLGMTKQEVRQVFGEPDDIHMYSSSEAWTYGGGHVWFRGEGNPATRVVDAWDEPLK